MMSLTDLWVAFYDTAGPGGAVVMIVLLGGCLVYWRLTRWIINGGKHDRPHDTHA
jgi:hypothetical protein